jgi:transaldolase
LERGIVMAKNRLEELHDIGQSIWLDSIDRRMLTDGELERRVRDDALTGMTSNPTIFQKALASSDAYDEQLLAAEQGLTPMQLFELVETTDVRDACDIFAGSKCLRASRTAPTRPSRKRAGCGRRSTART